MEKGNYRSHENDSESITINLIHHRPEYEAFLSDENNRLKEEIDRLKHIITSLENKYGYESRLNNELIDLLREYKIPFRQALQRANY